MINTKEAYSKFIESILTRAVATEDMDADLRNMVMAFRVTELQTLLAFAGKNKTGRKNELQARALELVKSRPNHVVTKIHDLYRSIQVSMNSSYGTTSTAASLAATLTRSAYAPMPAEKHVSRPPVQSYASYHEKAALLAYPLCPDVKFKSLPFFERIDELIKPTSLIPVPGTVRLQEKAFQFCLTPGQARDTAASKEYSVSSSGEQRIQYEQQVQLRFCVLETSCDQDDAFPASISVKVNGKTVPLPHPIPSNRPGVEPKRNPRPLNITNFVKLSPTSNNIVAVNWANEPSSTIRGYAMALYLVKKLSSQDLLTKLKAKGPKPAEYTRGMIKELIGKEDGECCIATGSLKVSIACPLGKSRMSLPCRPKECTHLQCFDAIFYIQMNEKKPIWNCPVCDKSTLFENLSIDGYFSEVLSKMSESEGNEIEVLPDGSWRSAKLKTEQNQIPTSKRIKNEADDSLICLDDDDFLDTLSPGPLSFSEKVKEESRKKEKGEVEVINISSSESEEETLLSPIKRRPKAIEDESSSSSDSSSTTDGDIESPNPSNNGQRTVMDVITLDSRSPTPEPRPVSPTIQTHQHHLQQPQSHNQMPQSRAITQPSAANYQSFIQNSRYHPYGYKEPQSSSTTSTAPNWNANQSSRNHQQSQNHQIPNNTMHPPGSLYNPFESQNNSTYWPFQNDPWASSNYYSNTFNPFNQDKH